jgi:hypothetical protein
MVVLWVLKDVIRMMCYIVVIVDLVEILNVGGSVPGVRVSVFQMHLGHFQQRKNVRTIVRLVGLIVNGVVTLMVSANQVIAGYLMIRIVVYLIVLNV